MASSVQLKLTEAHGKGFRACILWDEQGKALITAGEDARLLVHIPDTASPVIKSALHSKAVTALAMSPSGLLVASASLDHVVKLYSYPGLEFHNNVTRFTLPVRSLAFSVTGGLLAAAGDDDGIKLISTVDSSIVRVFKGHGAPVVSLAFDPKNDILASAGSDGTLKFWSLSTGKDIKNLKHFCPEADVDSVNRCEIAWHPNGLLLAVPGYHGDVVLLDRDTAEVQFKFTGGHSATVGLLAWSPNGKYLATAATDGKVMLWDAESKQDLIRLKCGTHISNMAWKPTGNSLAVIDTDGKFGVWEDAIPCHLPSPCDKLEPMVGQNREELLHFSDGEEDADEEASCKVSDSSEGSLSKSLGEDIGDELSDDEDTERLRKVTKNQGNEKKAKRISKKISKLESAVLKISSKAISTQPTPTEHAAPVLMPPASKLKPQMQSPIQPGSTQSLSGKRRFLVYNLLGSITSTENEGTSHVEVEFHDTSRGARVPSFNDYFGFTMAALSEKGSVYANPIKGDKTPSTLVYRPFSSWANNSEWSMRLAPNEEVRAVATGPAWVAAATSLNMLRIISDTGIQRFVLSLAGPVVALASHEQMLAVVTHSSDTSYSGDQVMEFVVLDVREHQRVLSGRLPLTPGALLSWLGFSESGILTTNDSEGVVRTFSSYYGGCWIPIFSLSQEQRVTGDSCWVVGLNSTQLYCIMCKAPELQPPVSHRKPISSVADCARQVEVLYFLAYSPKVLPKPVLSVINMCIPLIHSDLGAADLENELLRGSLRLSEAQAIADLVSARGQDGVEEEEQVLEIEVELDRIILRLLAAACKADKLARALDLAALLSLNKSLEGAIKVVNAMRLPSLAERLNIMLEEQHITSYLSDDKKIIPERARPDSVLSGLRSEYASPNAELPSNRIDYTRKVFNKELVEPNRKLPRNVDGSLPIKGHLNEIRDLAPLKTQRDGMGKHGNESVGDKILSGDRKVTTSKISAEDLVPDQDQNRESNNMIGHTSENGSSPVKRRKVSNAGNFVPKASNPFAKMLLVKEEDPSHIDVSLLDSLKKLKNGTLSDSKRKATVPTALSLQKPVKATKAS